MYFERLTQFWSLDVRDFTIGEKVESWFAYRIRLDWDEENPPRGSEPLTWKAKFAAFLEDPEVAKVDALIVGAWALDDSSKSSEEIVAALAAAKGRLASLRAIFLGDILSEENEISWINQCDLGALFAAYPNLEHLTVRGGEGLSLGITRHDHLRELVLQTGGLRREVVHEIFSAQLPALEKLELWLGAEGYGATTTLEDLAPLLRGQAFPNLRRLGLCDCEYTDEIAAALVLAPITEQLVELDLSLGTLGDAGARALLASPAIQRLERLDLHHNFLSPAMVAAFETFGPEVDTSEVQQAVDWGDDQGRFVAVGE